MEIFQIIIIFAVIAILIWLLVSNIRIVPQARAYVVERLGAYHGTWQVGLHFKIPLIDKISRKVSLKEKVIDFPPQPVITKDNVTMEIDTVVYFQITDPKLYTYGVESPMDAIENLTATTLRNIIGMRTKEAVSAVTPGQSAVFYVGQRLVGGAVIASQKGIGLYL